MNPWGLDCIELVELVTDYLEGALSEDARADFERHLALCGSCRDYLEQMRLTLRAVGKLEPDRVSPQALAALQHAFREWKKQ